jgi:hypothetical protein
MTSSINPKKKIIETTSTMSQWWLHELKWIEFYFYKKGLFSFEPEMLQDDWKILEKKLFRP